MCYWSVEPALLPGKRGLEGCQIAVIHVLVFVEVKQGAASRHGTVFRTGHAGCPLGEVDQIDVAVPASPT